MDIMVDELVRTMCSTEMPDHTCPVFCLFEKENTFHAKFSWQDIEINAVGSDESSVVLEAALTFMLLAFEKIG
ncbi:hypothetical protein [Aminobacterium colombiense]|jgi:hypothetical protein|uniref:hypothetical protein n=1 Tax=Aminobacterium colombiense TaxID=81468 RepID=UPI002596FE6B|nr:hypothetical protein [uncultured Aminobacterium sp.]